MRAARIGHAHGATGGRIAMRRRALTVVASSAKKLKYAGVGQRLVREPLVVSLQPDGADTWRLEPVFELLQHGGVSECDARPKAPRALTGQPRALRPLPVLGRCVEGAPQLFA